MAVWMIAIIGGGLVVTGTLKWICARPYICSMWLQRTISDQFRAHINMLSAHVVLHSNGIFYEAETIY